MNFIVNLKTHASHTKEYQSLEYTNWNPYSIQQFKIGDSLPADSIYLAQYCADILLFKIPRSKPRSLVVLDSEITNKVSLYFRPTVSTYSQLIIDLRKFVIDNILTSEEEELWYFKYREFDVDMDEKMVVINICGRS